MSRGATHKQAQQKWLPGLEPFDDVNKELATLRPCHNYEDLSFQHTSARQTNVSQNSAAFKAKDYLEGHWFVKIVASKHPDASKFPVDEKQIQTLQKLTLEDPKKVLIQLADTLNPNGPYVLATPPALATIGFQSSRDEATWREFNDKLREFVSLVSPSTSNFLSNKDYARLIDLGFKRPKTANALAKNISIYLSHVEHGDINPFGT